MLHICGHGIILSDMYWMIWSTSFFWDFLMIYSTSSANYGLIVLCYNRIIGPRKCRSIYFQNYSMLRDCVASIKVVCCNVYIHVYKYILGSTTWIWISIYKMGQDQQRHFKSIYERLNQWAGEILIVNTNPIFQCMGKTFCVEFQRFTSKFHTK